jgi:hypothetical protein
MATDRSNDYGGDEIVVREGAISARTGVVVRLRSRRQPHEQDVT